MCTSQPNPLCVPYRMRAHAVLVFRGIKIRILAMTTDFVFGAVASAAGCAILFILWSAAVVAESSLRKVDIGIRLSCFIGLLAVCAVRWRPCLVHRLAPSVCASRACPQFVVLLLVQPSDIVCMVRVVCLSLGTSISAASLALHSHAPRFRRGGLATVDAETAVVGVLTATTSASVILTLWMRVSSRPAHVASALAITNCVMANDSSTTTGRGGAGTINIDGGTQVHCTWGSSSIFPILVALQAALLLLYSTRACMEAATSGSAFRSKAQRREMTWLLLALQGALIATLLFPSLNSQLVSDMDASILLQAAICLVASVLVSWSLSPYLWREDTAVRSDDLRLFFAHNDEPLHALTTPLYVDDEALEDSRYAQPYDWFLFLSHKYACMIACVRACACTRVRRWVRAYGRAHP